MAAGPHATGRAVAMLGLGRMGLPMARHIATAGHRVVAFDSSAEARRRAAPVAEEFGFTLVDSAADLAETVAGDNIRLVCSSLPATEHVEAAYLRADGLAAARRRTAGAKHRQQAQSERANGHLRLLSIRRR